MGVAAQSQHHALAGQRHCILEIGPLSGPPFAAESGHWLPWSVNANEAPINLGDKSQAEVRFRRVVLIMGVYLYMMLLATSGQAQGWLGKCRSASF